MNPIFDRHRRGLGVLALVAAMIWCGAAPAQTSQGSASAQPVLPRPQGKPRSPVVDDLVGAQVALEVHKRPAHRHPRHAELRYGTRTRFARQAPPPDLERPALAGVALLAPLPRPPEPPHIIVPVPAYPLESIASAYLTPPPPIVCHRVPRVPGLPDPGLYRERTVACEADNP